MLLKEYKICKRCIMDTSDPEIYFDEKNNCNNCNNFFQELKKFPHNLLKKEKEDYLNQIVEKIKEKGKNKKYDCIIGVSGGVDSTYVAYLVKKLGLRPLAVHLDNGWNSELSVKNIENILNKLNIDLYTYVIDWEEFKDLQISFLKASTPDAEIPTDHAIFALLYKIANQNNIKYIIGGNNFNTESILPLSWSMGHNDWKYIKYIHKKFGTKKLKTYPKRTLFNDFYYRWIKKINYIRILDYIEYIKEDALKIIEKELEWKNYGGKHHESIYTKFFQAYILPVKFGFDKRRGHLSTLICSNQITREKALEIINQELYNELDLKRDIEYVSGKLGFTNKEFEEIMKLSVRKFWDYPSYEKSWYYKIAKKVYHYFKEKKRKKNKVI